MEERHGRVEESRDRVVMQALRRPSGQAGESGAHGEGHDGLQDAEHGVEALKSEGERA